MNETAAARREPVRQPREIAQSRLARSEILDVGEAEMREPFVQVGDLQGAEPRLAEGNIPRLPVSIDASSLRISPNMFSVTITSN